LILAARTCFASSGALPGNARAAALGGITVVGESVSPLKVAVLQSSGLRLETSWANPYGIDELHLASLSLRGHWRVTSVAVSMRSLNTPTSYGEVHLVAALSAAASENVSIGAGADLAWLSDSEGIFAKEVVSFLGLAVGHSEKWELGCAAFTPAGTGGPGDENGGVFRWGVGLHLGDRVSVIFEDERHNRRSVRRFGGEMDLTGDVAVRSGVSSPPLSISFGVGLTVRGTGLSLAVVQHEVLGATPYATISYGGSKGGVGKDD
jgi:hypothetical protein